MASMAMIAIEATIVSTAMPQIAAQLGQINLYSWVFSAFLLTQTATTVVFGKLADIYGRNLRVYVTHYLRPEEKFSNLEELKKQIAIDEINVRKLNATGNY